MSISTLLEKMERPHLLWGLLVLWVGYLFTKVVYNVLFHPLAAYPGPILARATPLPMVWHLCRGRSIDWTLWCHQRYGTVVRIAPNELSYSTEEAWKDIFSQDSPSVGRKWIGLYNPKIPQFQSLQGNTDNAAHMELRRIFSPAFSEKHLRDQEPMFKRVVNHMADRIKRVTQEHPGTPVDMTKFFMYVTFDIMGEFTFAQNFGMIEQMKYLDWITSQYSNLIANVFSMSASYLSALKPLVNVFTWIFREKLELSLQFATDQVNARIGRSVPEQGRDLWALTFRENKFGRKLSHRDMVTNALLFLLAGTETTATAMTGFLWYLHIHPAMSEKLIKEIRSSFTSTEDITMKKCAELPYLNACIEEVLRIYAPVKLGLPRVTPPEGMVIDGRFVPGGTVVAVSVHAANISPDNFRDPEKFIPERWIGDEYVADRKGARRPFSYGPRDCLGKSFAYHEMRLVLATLFFGFDLKLRPECEEWGVDQRVFGVAEKMPLLVDFTPRI